MRQTCTLSKAICADGKASSSATSDSVTVHRMAGILRKRGMCPNLFAFSADSCSKQQPRGSSENQPRRRPSVKSHLAHRGSGDFRFVFNRSWFISRMFPFCLWRAKDSVNYFTIKSVHPQPSMLNSSMQEVVGLSSREKSRLSTRNRLRCHVLFSWGQSGGDLWVESNYLGDRMNVVSRSSSLRPPDAAATAFHPSTRRF